MTVRRAWLLTALLLLVLVMPASAITYPQDDQGHTAAQCTFLNAAGVPTLCSPTAPLPMAAAGSGLTGSSVLGQNWFTSSAPVFDPFHTSAGVATGAPLCLFTDDVNVVCVTLLAAGTVQVYRSNNGGLSFTPTSISATALPTTALGSFTRATNGVFVLSELTRFWTSPDLVTWTQATCTGCGSFAAAPSSLTLGASATLLATGNDGSGNGLIARSTTNGTSWTVTTPANFPTPATLLQGGQLFSVTGTTWLAVGNFGGVPDLRISRSTDDGSTWTVVGTFSNASAGISFVSCLTSTLCLATTSGAVSSSGGRVFRSTDAGLTWALAFTAPSNTAAPNAASLFDAVFPFDSLTAVVAVVPNATGPDLYWRTTDGGLTWASSARVSPSPSCPQQTGQTIGSQTAVIRNGRAVYISRSGSTAGTGPCAYFAALGLGGVAITGPNGVPWDIGGDGVAPVKQGTPLNALTVAPVQGPTLFNSQTTGAANTAVVVTIAAVASQRAHLYRVEASCAAGTASLTVTDAGTTVWSTLATEVGTARFRQAFAPAGLTAGTNSALVVTLTTCGVGNAGTLIVHADRF